EGELGDLLAEIGLAGRPDAVGPAPEIDGGEVAVEDLVLRRLAVELGGEDRLPHLSGDRPAAAGIGVLHVLLGDGRAALHGLAADVGPQGPEGGLGVDSAVGVEAAVLDGHYRLLKQRRDVIALNGDVGLELPDDG